LFSASFDDKIAKTVYPQFKLLNSKFVGIFDSCAILASQLFSNQSVAIFLSVLEVV
jgi:hypothetical protein